jgi:hypothetical protein
VEEQIEMTPFEHGEGVGQGEGHEWTEGGSHNPTWCDLCGELIWGLYDTGASISNNHVQIFTAGFMNPVRVGLLKYRTVILYLSGFDPIVSYPNLWIQ